MASPMPMPSGFVLKKGSKMRATCSGGMPSPVSATSISMKASAWLRVVMLSVRAPLDPRMASMALPARLMTTC